jgi:aryl-alcohol dehydrogenase-like predicted oxidoreductase
METRQLGSTGLETSALGFGAMALVSGMYGAVAEGEGERVIRHALDRGVTLIDTADAYGPDGHNERLVGRALTGRRHEAVVATKFGYTAPDDPHATRLEHNWSHELWANCRPERVRSAAEGSLARLGVEAIDLYYLHVPDPAVAIEDTVGAMADLVEAGLVRHIGVSNLSADLLRRARAVHPIAALQYEWSLWARDIEVELLPAARELGIGIVPWSPLGSGFLTGEARVGAEGADFRRNNPRFSGDNLRANRDRFAPLGELAGELGITPAQLALAWLLHQGPDVVPIPGTRNPAHLDANVAATEVALTPEDLGRIDALVPRGLAAGAALLS